MNLNHSQIHFKRCDVGLWMHWNTAYSQAQSFANDEDQKAASY